MARPLSRLALILVLSGCGGAAATTHAEATTPPPTERVALRFRVTPGARYATAMRGRTETQGAVVLTSSRSDTWVESFDPTTRTVRLRTSVGPITLTDESGAAVAGPASADLSGVTFLRSLDDHRQLVGDVTVEGTSDANAGMAETTRAALRAGLTKLPDAPLAVGDHWTDATSTEVPIGPTIATFVCQTDSVLTAIDGEGDARVVSIRSTGTCTADAIALTTPAGNGSMSIDGTIDGTSELLLADGFTGTTETTTRTRFVTRVGGQPAHTLEMAQDIATLTQRVAP